MSFAPESTLPCSAFQQPFSERRSQELPDPCKSCGCRGNLDPQSNACPISFLVPERYPNDPNGIAADQFRAMQGPRPFLVPAQEPHTGSQRPLSSQDIAYFFTAAAAEQEFVHASWAREFCGPAKRVYVRMKNGEILSTGRASIAEALRDFDGVAVPLNQSVAVNRSAASLISLSGKDSEIEVQIAGSSKPDCLRVSRRRKRSVRIAFGGRVRRKRETVRTKNGSGAKSHSRSNDPSPVLL